MLTVEASADVREADLFYKARRRADQVETIYVIEVSAKIDGATSTEPAGSPSTCKPPASKP